MSVAAVRAEVNRRVQEALVPAVFERMQTLHQKWEWRDCPCSWCETKRRNHAAMQFSPHYFRTQEDRELWREGKRQNTRRALVEEAKVVITGE